MTVKRIVFIRPGETDWNRLGRWQGWVSIPLNDLGVRQARALANFIRHIGMGALYTSDLKRAQQTADCLAEQLAFQPIPDARLRERSIGLWQGLTQAELSAWYPDEYAAMLKDAHHYRVPGGESRAEVLARVKEAVDEILGKETSETVGILSHTTAIKVLLADMIPGYNPLDVDLDNTSVTTIHRGDTGWEIVAVDDVMHLEHLERRAFRELEGKP
ncbi:MAG TPA: histidine phosphatase family protein [Phototrophicaceae bacterium]|nr:histidine phosphatase family protein [Phototrophicaceae bacterium]